MLFVVHGSDEYRVKQRVTSITEQFQKQRDASGINVVTMEGEKTTLEAIRQEALTTPFLGEKKLIVIWNIRKNKKIQKDLAVWLEANDKVIDNALVFVDIEVVDPRFKARPTASPLGKLLDAQKYRWQYPNLDNKGAQNWLLEIATEKAANLEARAAALLVEHMGTDSRTLMNELLKLISYTNGETITSKMVDELSAEAATSNLFALIDAIADRQSSQALKLITTEFASGTHPLILTSALRRQLLIILQLKTASAASAKVHPFVAKKAAKQGGKFDHVTLVALIDELSAIELQLKSGHQNPELLFDMLVAK